jgi:hypothetical protein
MLRIGVAVLYWLFQSVPAGQTNVLQRIVKRPGACETPSDAALFISSLLVSYVGLAEKVQSAADARRRGEAV